MIDTEHPALSVEFLSRLHDGELAPAEQTAFESHRAACGVCRDAVAEFERSLAAFRGAATAPVPSDLSARILRKIRAQSPSRRPFGVQFGIDLRWAGLVVTALLVAIIAPVLFSRRSTPQTARPPDAISAYVVEEAPAPEEKAKENRDAVNAEQPAAPARNVPQAPVENKDKKAAAESDRRFSERETFASSAPIQAAADELGQKPQAKRELESPSPASSLSKSRRIAEARAGGEAGAVGGVGAEEGQSEKIHLEIRAMDGEGSPPEIALVLSDERLLPLRGREFILIVEAGGLVTDVMPASPGKGAALQRKDANAAAADAAAAPDAELLRELRFEPGGRPRRLMVRIE